MIRGVVFDVDDTLYDERDYVLSGFSDVAQLAGESEDASRALMAWLWTAFEAGVRGDTFDRLLEAYPDVAERTSARELISAYRAHSPTIRLAPGVEAVLDALEDAGIRLGVVSDGPVESQSAKAAALGLDRWFDPIILTGSLGPGFAKPSPGAFEAIARTWRLPHSGLVYVADNPEKDFAGPRGLGWRTIRIRHPRQLRSALEPSSPAYAPDFEIRAASDLLGRLGLDEPLEPGGGGGASGERG